MTQSRLLAAELRAGRKSALEALERALVGADGHVGDACASLGINRSTLYLVAGATPRVQAILDEHGQGHAGAARKRWATEKKRGISRTSKKST